MTTEPKNVFQALAAVQEGIGAVGKDTTRNGLNFSYRGIDDLLNALHPLLARHGVIIAPRVVEHETLPFGGFSKPHLISTVQVEYYVYGPDGSTLPQPICVVASGVDNSDKAYGKAMSYAFKIALGQLFTIPTEEDVEAYQAEEATPNPRGQAAAAWFAQTLTPEERQKIEEAARHDLSVQTLSLLTDGQLDTLKGWGQDALARRATAEDPAGALPQAA